MTEAWTLVELLKTTTNYLASKGVDSPRLDAERMLGHVLALNRVDLYLRFDQPIEPDELNRYRALVKRRARREPLQYILGETEFWSLPLTVNPAVLVPRPDTEILVEEALKRLPVDGAVLDVGAGSGAISVALAHESPKIQITALDISSDALKVVQGNAERHKVSSQVATLQADLNALPPGPWTMMVSNPPYIAEADYARLMPEVKDYEPPQALRVAGDGLACYRAIVSQAMECLVPGGWLLFEVGIDQAEAVESLLKAAGLVALFRRKDYSGIERVVGGRRP